jgi:hypothetical protein
VSDIMTIVARGLNAVASAGEARAAMLSAEAHLSYGATLVPSLTRWSIPTPDEAEDILVLMRAALDAELRTIGSQSDDSPVDPQSWARARRQVERAYIEVSGIAGAAGAQLDVDAQAGQILADAIADAPRVFAQGVGEVVGGVGRVVGQAGGGFLSGLGLLGVLVLIAVVALVIRAKGIA